MRAYFRARRARRSALERVRRLLLLRAPRGSYLTWRYQARMANIPLTKAF